MFRFIKRLSRPSNPLQSPDVSVRFAAFLTDKSNPDHIIVAHILQSFATEFDCWKEGHPRYYDEWKDIPQVNKDLKPEYFPKVAREYYLRKDGLDVYVSLTMWHKYHDECAKIEVREFLVNKQPIETELALGLLYSWQEIRDKHRALKEQARKSLEAMKVNEKKWDIVENVLGLKRLEDGSLVAKGGLGENHDQP